MLVASIHYARWLKKGAKRIEAASTDSLIQISSFKDESTNKFTVVAINNNTISKTVQFDFSAINLSGPINGEQSYDTTRWEAITSITPTSTGFTFTLLPNSITSFGGNFSLPTGIINTTDDNLIRVYPNPAQQTFNVESKETGFDIAITDVAGRNIFEQKNCSSHLVIDSKYFSDGVYSLRITPRNQKTQFNKLIILH